MAHHPLAPLKCPANIVQCDIISELIDLREKVTELSELVDTDTLTGLYNYRHFTAALAQEMERTRRTALPTGLIMIDLDFFKKVNDEWGHEVGNQALIQASQLIRAAVRKMDVPCRYGGEEFAVILPSTEHHQVVQVAERVREMIESTPVMFDEQSLTLTASLGLEVYSAGSHYGAEELVQQADRYLYQAKKQGRNRVCYAPVEVKEDISSVSQDEKDALFGLFGRSGGEANVE